jgi:hypothetical protein
VFACIDSPKQDEAGKKWCVEVKVHPSSDTDKVLVCDLSGKPCVTRKLSEMLEAFQNDITFFEDLFDPKERPTSPSTGNPSTSTGTPTESEETPSPNKGIGNRLTDAADSLRAPLYNLLRGGEPGLGTPFRTNPLLAPLDWLSSRALDSLFSGDTASSGSDPSESSASSGSDSSGDAASRDTASSGSDPSESSASSGSNSSGGSAVIERITPARSADTLPLAAKSFLLVPIVSVILLAAGSLGLAMIQESLNSRQKSAAAPAEDQAESSEQTPG